MDPVSIGIDVSKATLTIAVVPSQCQRTAALLRARGIVTRDVDLSELAKAEGALTCSSLIVELTGGQEVRRSEGLLGWR